MMRLLRSSQAFLFITFGIYCFIYPSSLLLLMFDGVPAGTEWMATLMLALEGVVAGAWAIINYGRWRGLATSIAILILAFGVEAIGVTTGFPFGQYTYNNVLYPKILSLVPLGITFAWLMMVLASYFTARFMINHLWPNVQPAIGSAAVIGLSALLSVGADVQMEPVAVHVEGYWTWSGTGGWYGVPVSNFIAWFGTSIIMALVLIRLLKPDSQSKPFRRKSMRFGWVTLALYQMNLIMFTAVNLSHAFVVAGIVGTLIEIGIVGVIVFGQPARTRTTYPRAAHRIAVEGIDNGESIDATL